MHNTLIKLFDNRFLTFKPATGLNTDYRFSGYHLTSLVASPGELMRTILLAKKTLIQTVLKNDKNFEGKMHRNASIN